MTVSCATAICENDIVLTSSYKHVKTERVRRDILLGPRLAVSAARRMDDKVAGKG